MSKFELKEGAGVYTPGDEQVGKVSGFVLDPATNEVTHLIVQKGWLFSEDKVVPFERVHSAAEDRVVLTRDLEDFDDLPLFEESHFLRAEEPDVDRGGAPRDRVYAGRETMEPDELPYDQTMGPPRHGYMPAYFWYPPHGYSGYPVGYYGWPRRETIRNIPEGTVPLKEGTNVVSLDEKHVGDVERLFIDPDSNTTTHFVISQGLLFKDRKLVPAHWVDSAAEDKVRLSVSSELLERLPSYED